MSRFDDAPDKYWHCYFGRDGEELRQYAMAHDLTKQQLLERVLEPWRARQPVVVGTTVIRDHDAVSEMKIVQTGKRSFFYEEAHSRRLGEMGIFTVGDIGFAAFHEGEDFTHELLSKALVAKGPLPDISMVLQLCSRLPHAAKPLEHRRKNKDPFKIADEYDAQDLLHALLRGYFKYVVSEEPIKKLANAKSTRADFAIEALGAIIELKYAYSPDDQGRIVDDLAKDLLFYEQWEPLKVVVYVVYNSSDLRDPEALDKLSGVRGRGGRTYDVYVIRA